MNSEFTATVWQEDEWFVAQCLEVDIASQGETEKEAFQNLREAIALYFEDAIATLAPAVHKLQVELRGA